MSDLSQSLKRKRISRRKLLIGALAGYSVGAAGVLLKSYFHKRESKTDTFVGKVSSYESDLSEVIRAGFRNLKVGPEDVRGKRVLLKPNLVETMPGALHICTQPQVILAIARALQYLGAAKIIVGEGSGHCRETARVAVETGLAELLIEENIPFVDLNTEDFIIRRNAGGMSKLRTLTFPAIIEQVDWIVSVAKMKTHHWACATLSMKNLFGLMPGIIYGWPKNVFHCAGIDQSILDINATVRPNFAIIDGIVAMEGDGPIMGTPKYTGTIVMGRNPAAVDATAARIMGIDPLKVPYLRAASGWLGSIREHNIIQRGETLASVQTRFKLLEKIPAHQGVRLQTV